MMSKPRRRSLWAMLPGFVLWAAGSALPATGAEPPATVVTPAFSEPVAGLPGKSMVAVEVLFPPGAKSAAHRHAPSAFIMAYVLEGEIRSQVDDGPVRVYRKGESWLEKPGALHRVSENASATNPAKLLAVFVLDSTDTQLVLPAGDVKAP